MNKNIIFCTFRDNKGATGGPGGVLFLQKEVLGNEISGLKCIYKFNSFCGGGKINSLLNIMSFFFECLFSKGNYYFTHDINSGLILGLLGKRYSMVYHNQGPMLEEKFNMGNKTGKLQASFIKFSERISFKNAITLHFPSNGAAKMYFDSKYASCNRDEVNLSPPLYNIIIPVGKPKNIDFELEVDKTTLTFFSLGTLTKAKGQDLSVDFISNFLVYYKEPVRYIIVGKGPLKEQIINKLDELKKIHHNFKYYYYESLPHNIVMYIHSISDVYIMLHRISIFDFATLEAMSQSSAIILSKVGGNPEFNYCNNVMFAEDAIENMEAFSKTDFEHLKIKNKETFDRYFSKDAFRRQYEEFVNNIVLG